MTQVSVDVPVRLQVMQDSINTLKRVLSGLKPESAPFKVLENTIKSMSAQMEKFQIQTSKSFGSQQQFNQAGKSIDKMEESLAKARLQLQNIKFSDLKLDKNQNNILEGFEKEFNAIDERVEQFKNQLKANILAAGNNSEILNNLMGGKAAEQSFDRLLINMTKKVQDFETQLKASQNTLNNFNVEKITKAYNVSQEGITRESLGGDLFDKFFTGSLDTNDLKFKGGVGKGKEKFLEAFAQQFEINPEELKAKIDKKGNAAAISEALKGLFGEGGEYNNIFNTKDAGYDKVQELVQNISQSAANIRQLQGLIDQLKATVAEGTPGAEHLAELQQQLDAVIVKEEEFQQGLVKSFKGNEAATSSLSGINSQLASFREQLSQANAQFLQLERSQQTFNSIKMAITNFMGFNQVLNLTKRAVQEAANHIKQLDTVMNGIAIVTDMTTADLWNQVDAYSEMAQKYGTTIQGAYEVSKIYYQAGYETNDVLTLMNETLKMSKISGLDYATTTDYMMNAIKGFKMEVADAASVVDVYSALAANTAVSQQELAEAMSKTASSMAGVGSTFEDTSAMIATMVAVTRESANNIGSAMKSIASRYGELTKDPAKLLDSEGEAMSFNKVDTALKSVGITLQTTDHQFRDFTDVILELSDVWDTLDSAQQRYIATQFAGNRCVVLAIARAA